jgi:hypothetical protein
MSCRSTVSTSSSSRFVFVHFLVVVLVFKRHQYAMVEELDIADLRLYFLADYLIKSLRLRADKWTKMMQRDDQNRTIVDFCDKSELALLVFHVDPAGNLVSN